MAENRSREEIIEELIPLFESGTYPEITPLAREFLGDEWPILQDESSYTTDQQMMEFLEEVARASDSLEAIIADYRATGE